MTIRRDIFEIANVRMLFQHAEEVKRRTLLLKVPKEAVNSKKRRKPPTDDHCDYLKRHLRPANRRRTDPVVVMSTILESILNEMRDLPDVQPFLFPVNVKVNVTSTYRCVSLIARERKSLTMI